MGAAKLPAGGGADLDPPAVGVDGASVEVGGGGEVVEEEGGGVGRAGEAEGGGVVALGRGAGVVEGPVTTTASDWLSLQWPWMVQMK